ncbi:MAG: IclR family transcriptional regulator [Roseibium sp.]|uniref:IclR family transcriptional regulator n=1 Tax=Roseibium sp. TaxID=1936156 RepID=UPI00260D865A|nr:IclR family transcriptional regulator [Roseibium sp.]MCV0427694.1 IclR family transcriptional regulator [Roseibium sp.]
MQNANRKTIGALGKCMKILEVFGPNTPELRLDEIAGLTGINRSSAQRSVHTLCQLGYLERQSNRPTYRLSAKVLDLSFAYMRFNDLLKMAAPVAVWLANTSGVRTDVVMRDGNEVVYLLRIPSRSEMFSISPAGRRWGILSSAYGRTILAKLDPAVRDEITRNAPIIASTGNTVTDRSRIAREIQKAAEQGYAYQCGEVIDGAATIASPIVAPDGAPVAAIGLGTTVTEMQNTKTRKKLANAVVNAARSLSTIYATQ